MTSRTIPVILGAVLLINAGAAHAQRATSGPSADDAAGAAPVPPPPTGFPAPLGSKIVFGGEIESHLQTDIISQTGSPTRVGVFNDTSLSGFLNYSTWLSFNAEAHLERNRNSNLNSYYPDRNTFFRSEGLTLRQIYVTIRPIEGLAIYGGKFHPAFGSAYELAPGQFYNFGTDYEQDERIGGGIAYTMRLGGPEELGLGTVRISAETFYLDTTFLSNSLLSRPALDDPTADRLKRYTRDQFGPSNTGSFASGTFALKGGLPGRGLYWQISATHQATSEPGGKSEDGQSIGATYDPTGSGIPLTPRLGLTPYLEYAHFSNFGTTAGLERHYLSGGLTFAYAKWSLGLAGGLRNSRGAGTGTDHLENATLAYELFPGFQLGGGLNFINIAGKASFAVSPALNFKRSF